MRKIMALAVSGGIAIAGCSGNATQDLEEQAISSESKQAGDGPFGLDLSAGPSDLDIDDESSAPDTGFYLLKSVPSPASEFETYGVVAFEEVGICEIRSVTAEFPNDSLGSAAITQADSLAKALSSKYGEGEKTDFCGGSDISCLGEFWAMSVMQGQRAYGYEWQPKDENVRSISLYVTSDNLARLGLRLDYKIGDEKACEDAVNAVRASKL